MGTIICGEDMIRVAAEVKRMRERINGELSEIESSINQYIALNSYNGAIAQSTKDYMEEVHVKTLIPLIRKVLEEYELKVLRYAYMYMETEEREDFYISEDVLNEALYNFDTEGIDAIGEACEEYKSDVSDYVTLGNLETDTLHEDYDDIRFLINKLFGQITDNENYAKNTELVEIDGFIKKITKAVLTTISRSSGFITEYEPGNNMTIQNLKDASILIDYMKSDCENSRNAGIRKWFDNRSGLKDAVDHSIAVEKVDAALSVAEKIKETSEIDLTYVASLIMDWDFLPIGARLELMNFSKGNLWDKIVAYIPDFVHNKSVIQAFEVLRFFSRNSISVDKIVDHYENNIDAIGEIPEKFSTDTTKKTGFTSNGFITQQYAELMKKIQYGKKGTMYESGCEVISVYNALVNMEGQANVPCDYLADLISTFESDGSVRNGAWGTSPKALEDYFNARDDYQATLYTSVSDLSTIEDKYDNYIVTVYNDGDDISQAVHTMFARKDSKGKFYMYNTYEGSGINTGSSLEAVLPQNNQVISVIGIERNE